MAERVRARRLSEDEGRRLQQIVRRGKHGTIRVRRAMMIMASASGTPIPAIARLVAADEDTVRKLIHDFNDRGLACLDPRWAGGRPRLISDDDVRVIVATATTRPMKLGLPFTRWSIRKLAGYLKGSFIKVDPAMKPDRLVILERERLRQILQANGVTFQRTRTWKESPDPDFETKLNRIEHVTTKFPDRCFAFDQFGPLAIRPHHGSTWNRAKHPDRLPATYHRTHGIRYFHGCYSLGDDQLWGVNRHRKGGGNTLAAIKSIRAARPDGAPIYVILDNLSANKTPAVKTWCDAHNVELCLTPTYASWANPIEAQFGPLRMFTMAASNYPNHTVLARDLQQHLRWRNANARHPDLLAAQRRERARIRAEKGHRWGRPKTKITPAAA
ncbi:IS630 family transposase [Kineosporia mesophila]|uniref:IS630 family transposase n=1 Tax=Kineosporia mesophila TaxID=566012 RepID=A0ABP6ZW51_9ACTN|nr:IS630 family transposase [Kineosporia mesophila]MCD5353297.1 IS630 family transposase [Kineosporia mesophila]